MARRPVEPGIGDGARALVGRLSLAVIALSTLAFVGALGYRELGGWPWADTVYMAISTISGVGLGELLPGMDQVPGARTWTVMLILGGNAMVVVFGSALTAFLVEFDLGRRLWRNRMSRALEQQREHVVVCGAGSTGIHVIEELVASGTPLVVVDRDPHRLERIRSELGDTVLTLEGDATEDEVLEQAGVRFASGLVASLHDDRDNLFVTVTARALSDRLRIVAKATEAASVAKLERGGANVVVAPARIGGRRIASEIVRPTVVQLLDAVARDLRDHDPAAPALAELPVSPTSPAVGHSLAASGARLGDVKVLALRRADGRHVLDPAGDTVLEAGATLVVFGRGADLAKVRAWCAGAP